MNPLITAIYVSPNQAPAVVQVESSELGFQSLLHGPVEEIFPYFEEVMLLCGAKAKIQKLPPNRVLYDDNDEYIDIVAGDFYLVGAPFTAQNYVSLTKEQIEKYLAKYQVPDNFRLTSSGYQAIRTDKTHKKQGE